MSAFSMATTMTSLVFMGHSLTLSIRYIAPSIVLLIALSLVTTRPSSLSTVGSASHVVPVVVASRVPRRTPILVLLSLISLTYLLDGMAYVFYAVFKRQPTHNPGVEFNTVIGLGAFSGLAVLGAWKEVNGVEVWFLRRVKFAMIIAFALDVVLAALLGTAIRSDSERRPVPAVELLHLAFPICRALFFVPLITLLAYPRVVYSPVSLDSDDEDNTSSFLHPSSVNPSTGLLTAAGLPGDSSSKYGTFRNTTRSLLQHSNPATRAPSPIPEVKTDEKPEINLDPSWSEIWARIRRLRPYLWPSKSRSLQLVAYVCIFILIIGRIVNAVVPFALGELVHIFEERDRSPWLILAGYVSLRFLQGSGGLAALRDALWIPVMQYSDREMSQLSFDHLLNLSFAFHTRRKTGEILRVLDRGAAINHTFELILFNIIPTFIDISIALLVFCFTFDWTLALVLFFVMFAYVSASVVMTRWRTKIRRQMNERDIITRGIHTDCLLNYETVKYFCGEEHEGERYREAVHAYQVLEYRVNLSLNLLNLVQNFIITMGLLVGSIIVARRVIEDQSGPKDFVIFITYLGQLYTPLNQLGYIYRSVNQSLIDTEKLLKLLSEPTEINDKPNAPPLDVVNGEIEFENVTFSYDGRTTALNGVSFKVPKNSSVALVGESGSGKSTILRLLYRFYDLQEGQGRILIDGQDIRDVTQKSLRQSIGVVPQDSVLFNTSIAYNIGYGKFGASQEEIEAAAASAQMHDRITSFPKGYETVVGERGVRLSGGEKQRVAIARTLLKNPPILLLDEATSALDTSTEKDIQKALQNLMMGRSSLSIAHRLSTIATADLIVVLKDGQIVEQGSHKELLALDGVFASMWADQISGSDATPEDGNHELSGYAIEGPDAEDAPSIKEAPITPARPETDQVPDLVQDSQQDKTTDHDEVAEPTEEVKEAPKSADVLVSAGDEVPPSPAPAPTSPPVAFPMSDDEPLVEPAASSPTSPPTPGVTFPANLSDSPRAGTPDPESEPKRKRISSQNFQRLARRISITTRRQGSVSSLIPGLKRDSSPRVSTDEQRGEGSVPGSPTPSEMGTDQGTKKKKDKKLKRKSLIP